MHSTETFRSWAKIDLSALTFNVKRLRSLNPSCELIGVVKADAYGHGLFAIAKALSSQQMHTFAVANILEAETASSATPKADILLLSSLLPQEIPETVAHPQWLPTISSRKEFRAIEKEAARQKRKVRVHIKLDTGMGRLGGFENEILLLLQVAQRSPWITVTGLYSHLASSDIDIKESYYQLNRLSAFRKLALKYGISVSKIHFQNSAGILRMHHPDWIKAVRSGLSLYGVPSPHNAWKKRFGKAPLKPVLTWKTRVVLLRDMPRGVTISYAGTFRTRVKTRIAILSAGYADGISRKLSNRGEVLIRGCRCPILGRVTMDMIIVNVTHVPKIQWGDPVVLIGKSGKEEITTQDIAHWAETNSYEVLCNISKRVPRIVSTF